MNEQIDKNPALTQGIQKLLDKDAIEELWYNSCYLVDEGDLDGVMESFTGDAVMDTGSFGRAEGKDAIREMLKSLFSEGLLFTRHMVHNPVIQIDGEQATGKWYLDCPAITGEGKAVWSQGIYKHEFRRTGGKWKISKFTFEASYVTPYEKGWVEQPFLEGMPGELNWKSGVHESAGADQQRT
jgi:ketosteroid isomerase-like protein